jgi:hypothetical protein
MTLTAKEFIRRFLQHVLPTGVHKVRYYGLWAPSNKTKLQRIRRSLTADDSAPAIPCPEGFGGPVLHEDVMRILAAVGMCVQAGTNDMPQSPTASRRSPC